MKQIHGHEVMKMMIESEKSYSKDELKKAIINKFGEDARFHTCSVNNMDADEIIVFLEKKDKFTHSKDGVSLDASKMCSHE